MKKRTKGILAFAFLGGIMITSGVVIAIPGIAPDNDPAAVTGTPADNFPEDQRVQFCGYGNATSTDYIQEYAIPTLCTNPLAIVTDYDGNAWFAQTNTGKLAKFDPVTESFTEYDNTAWPAGARSMMWGIDYAPDGSIWFTDEAFDSVWKFSTIDEKYERFGYPASGDPLPQKLQIHGSQIIINDFTGNKLTLLDPGKAGDVSYLSIPSPIDNSATADFAVDANNDIWFTNWLFQQGGILVKFNQNQYLDSIADSGNQLPSLLSFIDVYTLPVKLLTPNGAVAASDGTIWLTDTSSSFFFNFNPLTEKFTQYVTAQPKLNTYGNQTGVVQSPISRPYWIEADEQGRLVFNAQTANNISVMDPETQSLVEYHIPSKNPHWGDCDPGTGIMMEDCGLAQVFDLAVDGEKIWFTEWVENNIGVVDTSVPLPFEIQPESDAITISPGDTRQFSFVVSPMPEKDLADLTLILSSTSDSMSLVPADGALESLRLDSGASQSIPVSISVSNAAISGTYKALFGVQSKDVAVSKFVTVTIT